MPLYMHPRLQFTPFALLEDVAFPLKKKLVHTRSIAFMCDRNITVSYRSQIC